MTGSKKLGNLPESSSPSSEDIDISTFVLYFFKEVNEYYPFNTKNLIIIQRFETISTFGFVLNVKIFGKHIANSICILSISILGYLSCRRVKYIYFSTNVTFKL